MPTPYTPAEVASLAGALLRGEGLACPRCGSALDRREVPARRDVSYVRDRVWVVCPACRGTAVLDRREDAR